MSEEFKQSLASRGWSAAQIAGITTVPVYPDPAAAPSVPPAIVVSGSASPVTGKRWRPWESVQELPAQGSSAAASTSRVSQSQRGREGGRESGMSNEEDVINLISDEEDTASDSERQVQTVAKGKGREVVPRYSRTYNPPQAQVPAYRPPRIPELKVKNRPVDGGIPVTGQQSKTLPETQSQTHARTPIPISVPMPGAPPPPPSGNVHMSLSVITRSGARPRMLARIKQQQAAAAIPPPSVPSSGKKKTATPSAASSSRKAIAVPPATQASSRKVPAVVPTPPPSSAQLPSRKAPAVATPPPPPPPSSTSLALRPTTTTTRVSPPRIYLQDACLLHKFIRGRDKSNVFERPERLRAINVGIAAAYARLEFAAIYRAASDECSASSSSSSSSGGDKTKTNTPVPLHVVRSSASVDICSHAPARVVHGNAHDCESCYATMLKSWCADVKEQIALCGSEIPDGYEQDLYCEYLARLRRKSLRTNNGFL